MYATEILNWIDFKGSQRKSWSLSGYLNTKELKLEIKDDGCHMIVASCPNSIVFIYELLFWLQSTETIPIQTLK